jgi:hypothetical protein
MADELVTIAEYMDSMQAQLAVQALADFGIKAVLIGQHATDVYGGIPAFSTVKLQVMQSRADEAKEILEEQQQGREPEEYEVGDQSDEADEPYDPQEEEQ